MAGRPYGQSVAHVAAATSRTAFFEESVKRRSPNGSTATADTSPSPGDVAGDPSAGALANMELPTPATMSISPGVIAVRPNGQSLEHAAAATSSTEASPSSAMSTSPRASNATSFGDLSLEVVPGTPFGNLVPPPATM